VDDEEKKARGENPEKSTSALHLPRIETEEMLAAREKSVAYLRKTQQAESFVKLKFFGEEVNSSCACGVFWDIYSLCFPPLNDFFIRF
jgi:hypothetical protein